MSVRWFSPRDDKLPQPCDPNGKAATVRTTHRLNNSKRRKLRKQLEKDIAAEPAEEGVGWCMTEQEGRDYTGQWLYMVHAWRYRL